MFCAQPLNQKRIVSFRISFFRRCFLGLASDCASQSDGHSLAVGSRLSRNKVSHTYFTCKIMMIGQRWEGKVNRIQLEDDIDIDMHAIFLDSKFEEVIVKEVGNVPRESCPNTWRWALGRTWSIFPKSLASPTRRLAFLNSDVTRESESSPNFCGIWNGIEPLR